jgi:hypothetical protein
MSTKTREELQAEYQKRLRAGLGYVGPFDSGLTNAHRVADSVAALLAELATQRPAGPCDHRSLVPAPAPVEAVTTELDDWLASVRGDWMPSGADEDCLRAAKADQLAARAQDQARIAELERELDEVREFAGNGHAKGHLHFDDDCMGCDHLRRLLGLASDKPSEEVERG